MAVKPETAGFTAEEIAMVESPELTDEELASLRRGSEALSSKLFAALASRKPGQRGPQKSPTKMMTTLRLDYEILASYRATGAGWQRRINEVLREALVSGIMGIHAISIGAREGPAPRKAKAQRVGARKAPVRKQV